MSFLSTVSLWSSTMSTTSKSTLDVTTSTPHTSVSSSSVVTGLKASLGSGPFFHARLQEGQRIEEQPPAGLRYQVSTYAIGPDGVVSPGNDPQKSKDVNGREESPRVTHRHAKENGADNSPSAFTSTTTPIPAVNQHTRLAAKKLSHSASATAIPSDPTDFWKMVAEAQEVVNGPSTPVPRHYHYITRSQSASAATDASYVPPAPKMRKQNASYSPGFGTPAYHENVENVPVTSSGPWYPTRGRHLSPIEEAPFSPEKLGDSASLHSTASAQSNLFIHRSVRRTGSASTFNSGHSRSPEDATSPNGVSPSRSYGQSRPVAALPVIPASPRESQNVFEQNQVSMEDAKLASPMPVVYPSHADHPVFQGLQEQDLGEATLSTLRFADPRYWSGYDENTRASMPHSSTPSLLSRSESIQTELTYLTAQDSAANSRRVSAVSPGDLESGNRRRSPLVGDGDTTAVNTPKPSPVARLKASIDTIFNKSPKMRKSPGGIISTPTADATSALSVSKREKLLSQMQEMLKKHAPWRDGKPAEILFWTGFVAPWCWLIGGWMLARNGQTMAEGLQRRAKEPELPQHSAPSLQLQLRRQRSREMRIIPVNSPPSEKQNTDPVSIWQAAKASSVELLESLRGHGKRSQEDVHPTTVRAIALSGDVPVPILITTRVDPWVARCRVAAVVSGMFILALCIVALVVLVRSL